MLSLEVCRAALAQYRDTDHVRRTAALGARLKERVNRLAKSHGYPLRVLGYDPIPFFLFAPDPEVHVRMAEPFVGAMARRGVLLRRDVSFLSGAHSEAQIDFTCDAVEGALAELSDAGSLDPVAGEGGPA
jgi:aminotransferase MxcL